MPNRRKREVTFRERLTGQTTLLCLGVLALASIVIYGGVRQTLYWNLDNALISIAQTEIAAAVSAGGGGVQLHEGEPLALRLRGGLGYEKFAQIEDAAGNVLARTNNLANDDRIPVPAADRRRALRGQTLLADVELGGRRFRAVYSPLPDADNLGLIAAVALPTGPMQFALNMLLGTLGLAALLIGAAAAWTSGRLARRLTAPLETIASAARQVSEEHPEARIPAVASCVELTTVTQTLNEMLERLESALHTRDEVIAAQRRFIADASHELCTPLTSLRGTLEIALRRPRSYQEYLETVRTAETETVRLCRLVRDLLTLSRADSGQFAIQRSRCDLANIAESAAEVYRATAAARNILIRFESESPAPVFGDPDRLREVVDNLLSNAVRYAPPETAVVLRVWAENHSALLSVCDRGPGLTEEEARHVFDRFYRTDRARARNTGGMGLGLAIAAAIMKAHGGAITVQTRPGEGACFRIALPLDLERIPAAQTGSAAPLRSH